MICPYMITVSDPVSYTHLDDFGKGYSSLSLLKTLSVDVLKIDSFFFDNGDDEERDMEVVHGIIDLVHKFQIRTVAEGIENMKQVEYLKQMGCDYIPVSYTHLIIPYLIKCDNRGLVFQMGADMFFHPDHEMCIRDR